MVALVCATQALPLYAEKADRDQPLNVEANSGRYDDSKQVGVFVGNVVVSKGTLVLRASQVELRQSKEGYQLGIATGTPQQLASFRQKRDGVDEYIEGRAERIEYDSHADSLRLVNRAVVRRYRGSTLIDETSGSLITYNNAAATFEVSGLPSGAASGASAGRVRATLAVPAKPPAAAASHSSVAHNPTPPESKR